MPEIACPQRCSFCNQQSISGISQYPDGGLITQIIERHLSTIDASPNQIDIAFFGGTFTGIPFQKQHEFLSLASKWIKTGKVGGIRISTRPDYITPDILTFLLKEGVTTIELGAQSLDDDVLTKANRGHTVEDILKSSEMILKAGFRLGLQMMIGLPGDSAEKSLLTAKKIISAGAVETRIYPCLVLDHTALAQQYRKGEYVPISINDAVNQTLELYLLFEKHEVNVIRMGLHRNEEFDKGNFLAGPYHPNFKELVMTELWSRKLRHSLDGSPLLNCELTVHPSQVNFVAGYQSKNRKWLSTFIDKIQIKTDNALLINELKINKKHR